MDDWDAQKMLDLYIHDYMVTNNMHTVADIFAKEAGVLTNAEAINTPKEFLTDWWSLFWDVYCARTETARQPETAGASSSKDTQTTQNVPTNVIPTIPRPELSHIPRSDFNAERNKVKQVPSQGLPSTQFATTEALLQRDFTPNLAVQTSGKLEFSASINSTNAGNPILVDDSSNYKDLQSGKIVIEEEPLDIDCFFNDNPDDRSILPHSSPVCDRTEQKDDRSTLLHSSPLQDKTEQKDDRSTLPRSSPLQDKTKQKDGRSTLPRSSPLQDKTKQKECHGGEPLDVDYFFNDNPDDRSTLPRSSTLQDKTEQKGLSFEEVESFQTKTKLRCCHFSTSGKLLAAAGHDSKLLIWNLESHSTNVIKTRSNIISDIRFKPGSSVFATSSLDRNVQVWDAFKPEKSKSILVGHAKPVMSVDFHPTKLNILCSCDNNDEIRLWNVNESACILAFKGANRQVRFEPRSGKLLAAALGNVINVIDVETNTIKYRLEGHAKDVNSMCWDTSGRFMASVSEDCARIWSIAAGGKSVHQLQSTENKFLSCTFHPVYSLVLAIGSYQSLQIWNPMDSSKIWSRRVHEGIVSSLTNTYGTHRIASVSHDSWMKVWK